MPTLRSRVIRLAHTKPELRSHLLPLLKESTKERTIGKTVSGMPIPESKREVGLAYLDAAREAKSFANAASKATDDAGRSSQHAMAAAQHYEAAKKAKELGDSKAQHYHETERKKHLHESDTLRKKHGPPVGVPKGLPGP